MNFDPDCQHRYFRGLTVREGRRSLQINLF